MMMEEEAMDNLHLMLAPRRSVRRMLVKYCSENNKRLIHFSTCEVYAKTIRSFLLKGHPLHQPCREQHKNLLVAKQKITEHGITQRYMKMRTLSEVAAAARSNLHKIL